MPKVSSLFAVSSLLFLGTISPELLGLLGGLAAAAVALFRWWWESRKK